MIDFITCAGVLDVSLGLRERQLSGRTVLYLSSQFERSMSVQLSEQASTGAPRFVFADMDKALEIADLYIRALGREGIIAEGHDPYPNRNLFSENGIRSIIESPECRLITMELEGKVIGAILARSLHKYACELSSLVVDEEHSGRGFGSALIVGARKIIDDCFFVANLAELLTSNIASQRVHIKNGYERFVGFAYSCYPNIYFDDRPESVIWAGLLQGRLVRELPQLRARIGETVKESDRALIDQLAATAPGLKGSTGEEKSLAFELLKRRDVYLPARYASLGIEILTQYLAELDYHVSCEGTITGTGNIKATVDFKPDCDFSHIDFPPNCDVETGKEVFRKELNRIRSTESKRYIKATIRANDPSCIRVADFLSSEGFVFHSLLPLYAYEEQAGGGHKFDDLLVMQWVRPDVVLANPLPGETRSVIKLYGYPLNLPGRIIKQLREDYRKQP